MRKKVDDLAAVAEEFGGRLGFLVVSRAPTVATDGLLEGVIVRCVDRGDGMVVLVCNDGAGELFRVLIPDRDFEWIMENPVEHDEDDDDVP